MSTELRRIVPAVHGRRQIEPDDEYESGFAASLRARHSRDELAELYTRFMAGRSDFDVRMRRALWRALAQRVGQGVRIGCQVQMLHAETFEIGDAVFIGDQSMLQGRFEGSCIIGNHVWIGPHSYFDARDLIIGDHVGWGPGAKVLGSQHTGVPADVPIVQTDLEIRRVVIEEWADIGTNAVILPGVTVGKGAIVGAGAVVTADVEPFTVVAGVPAKPIRSRLPR
jgi:acetyltransferase-like isoleucine patch superfamily enzyme